MNIGGVRWAIIDFGEDLNLGGILRVALEESEKTERNQRGIIHLAAAYEWVLQGVPGGPIGDASANGGDPNPTTRIPGFSGLRPTGAKTANSTRSRVDFGSS